MGRIGLAAPPGPLTERRPLDEAAAAAPTGAGVYLFLDGDRRLLYVGKAGNLRRRLAQHAHPKAPGPRLATLYARVAEVHWEEHDTEDAALAREADLVVGFRPPFNAALQGEGHWRVIGVHPDDDQQRLTFRLADRPEAGNGARWYGCFPHLGAGGSSALSTACTEGHAALLRLVWAARGPIADTAVPSRLAGPSASAEVRLATEDAPASAIARALHPLLQGQRDRVVDELLERATDRREAYLLPALRRDAGDAHAFFAAGPRRLGEFRRRHGLPARSIVDRDTYVRCLHDELVARCGGPFTVAAPTVEDELLGRRAHRWRRS